MTVLVLKLIGLAILSIWDDVKKVVGEELTYLNVGDVGVSLGLDDELRILDSYSVVVIVRGLFLVTELFRI